MTASAKKIHPPTPKKYPHKIPHPPSSFRFKMADGYFTMRSDLDLGEEKLLTKLVCFLRTGDFMANSPRITVDLIVVSSL